MTQERVEGKPAFSDLQQRMIAYLVSDYDEVARGNVEATMAQSLGIGRDVVKQTLENLEERAECPNRTAALTKVVKVAVVVRALDWSQIPDFSGKLGKVEQLVADEFYKGSINSEVIAHLREVNPHFNQEAFYKVRGSIFRTLGVKNRFAVVAAMAKKRVEEQEAKHTQDNV